MQRWHLEVLGVADELDFPDEMPPDEVQATIEVHLEQMCDETQAYYWRMTDKRGLNPVPKRFR
jgi:hypothetical protein